VPWRNTEIECERMVADLIAMMDTSEKAGQLIVYPMPPIEDREAIRALEFEISRGRVGVVSGISDIETASRLQDIAQNESRLGIPLLFPGKTDEELDTALPAPLTMAASWDLEAIENAEKVKAFEATTLGINWALGPKIELTGGHDHPGCSSGSDMYLAARIASARIAGLQALSWKGDAPLMACLELSRQSLGKDGDALEMLRLVQAVAAKARVGAIALDPEDMLAPRDHELLLAFLERPGSYDGLTLSHGDALSKKIAHGDTKARWDTIAFDALITAIRDGTLPLQGLEEAARRLLRAKFRLGLLRAAHAPAPSSAPGTCATPAHNREMALQCAKRCPILLRNDGNLLPLDIEPSGILLVGSAAQDRKIPAAGRAITTSVIDGVEQLGIPHRFVTGLALRASTEHSEQLIAADNMAIVMACEAARHASTVVFFPPLTEDGTLGEASQALLKQLYTANPRLVMVTIGPLPVDPLIDGDFLPCILHAGQLGTMSGQAIAEILIGEAAPVGRLPIAMSQVEPHPGLPFGHGLSYAEFTLSELDVHISASRIVASVSVSNKSSFESEQVVQLYLRDPSEMSDANARRLAGFKRLLLRAEECAKVDIELEATELGTYSSTGRLSVEPGQREIFVGFDSVNGTSTIIEISDEIARALVNQTRISNVN